MPFRRLVQIGDRVVELAGEFLIVGQLAQGAFAGVDVGHQLVGVGHRRVQIVVQAVVVQQFAGRAFPLIQCGGNVIQPLDRRELAADRACRR